MILMCSFQMCYANFLIRLFVFVLLSSQYILGINPLLDACFSNIVPYCVSSLEKKMATHSSGFLPGKISWAEEPGGLKAMRLQRVGHN